MKIMVSACLVGENCKYNGNNNYNQKVIDYLKGNQVITVCPELLGGLGVPRLPAEIVNGIVTTRDGVSADKEYRDGANAALLLAKQQKVDLVILQSRSPSCGVNQIYDGTFSGKKISGSGVFAKLLIDNGFRVTDAEDL